MKVKTGLLLLLVFAGLNFLGASPGYSQDIIALDAGYSHTVALRKGGTVWTWGRNSNGQLGDGSYINKNVPTRVAMLTDIIGVAAGHYHTLAVKKDGTVWAWGWNGNGQLGDGTATDRTIPVQVKDPSDPSTFLTNVISAAAGERYSLVLKADGTVWAWGYNNDGQLGDGTYTESRKPVKVKDPLNISGGYLTGVKAIATGSRHSIALKTDKTVWTWGSNTDYMSGRIMSFSWNPEPHHNEAGQVAGMTNVKAVAGGWAHTVILKEDGTVWAAGSNLKGQLGNGTTEWSSVPNPSDLSKLFFQVIDSTGHLTGIVAIGADEQDTVAVKQDGSVRGWGSTSSFYGPKLCDSTFETTLAPIKMKDPSDPTTFLSGVDTVASGVAVNLMLKRDGTIWGCGGNYYGQLGDGTWDTPRPTPVQTKFPPASLVYVYGLNFISPGEEGTFLVEYENILGFTLENAVVVFNLPGAFTYVSSTIGAIYRSDANQVFWKLGNLIPGSKGQLYVKVNVPWGLPLHSIVNLMVNMGAVNYPGNLNVNEYLAYGTVQLVQNKTLTTQEIATLRSQDPALEGLLTQALALGFRFYDVAQQVAYNDGTTFIRLVLFDFTDFAPAFLYSIEGRAHIEKVQQDKYTLFDLNGGMTINRNNGSIIPWGRWAESHSLTFYQCMFNCAIEGIPSYLMGKYIKIIGALADAKDCAECSLTQDEATCLKCAHSLNDLGWESFKEFVDAFKCVNECYDDPDSHICTNRTPMDKKECDPGSLFTWFSTNVLEMGVRYETKCNQTLGIYGATVAIMCAIGQVCSAGECKDSGAVCQPPNCASKEAEIRVAHDPNIKQADVKGDVLPGQRITYTVECQNLGAGTAYGVFILDELDPNLNEATLNINNGGSYIASGRLLSWNIGTLAPSENRTVSFSVNFKSGLANGVQITNKAKVYFPSSNEITPTNPVVHEVYTLAADPQILTTTSGTATSVKLTGRGPGPLSYQITAAPRYGTLTGTPPSLTYQSMDEFVGQDSLGFVVSSGGSNSRPATVTLNVGPNPSDTKPPTVVSTSPASGAANLPFVTVPVAQNPTRYSPAITATFSEALDSSTVNTSTFKVVGLTGAVSYDELTKTAVFLPLSPLDSSKSYTAQLTAGIRDKMGNAISPYSWQFSFVTNPPWFIWLPLIMHP